jgi:hypothetical protein
LGFGMHVSLCCTLIIPLSTLRKEQRKDRRLMKS